MIWTGADDATIAGALLHDVGQFLPYSDAKDLMTNGTSVGRASHEKIGEIYLRGLGFPEKVCELVGAHVVAKRCVVFPVDTSSCCKQILPHRYLTAVVPGYLESLSSASNASLKHQVRVAVLWLEIFEISDIDNWERVVHSPPKRSRHSRQTPCGRTKWR